MADQPLSAAKVEYLDADLGGATTWLVPEAIGVSLLGGELEASNTPTIRPPFPRAVTNFRA